MLIQSTSCHIATSNTLPNTSCHLSGTRCRSVGLGLRCLRCFWLCLHMLNHWTNMRWAPKMLGNHGKPSSNCFPSQTWIHRCNWRMWVIQTYSKPFQEANKTLGEAPFESRPQTRKFCSLFVFSIRHLGVYITTTNIFVSSIVPHGIQKVAISKPRHAKTPQNAPKPLLGFVVGFKEVKPHRYWTLAEH